MPVARHPPCRPGRAVFPPPVPRLYSPPRCKAEPSSIHSSTSDFGDVRPCYLYSVEDLGELLPGGTAPLAASPVEPLKRTVHGPIEEAVQRAGVPSHPVVMVVASQPCVQTLEELTPRQVPGLFHPCRDPPAGRIQLLPRRAPCDAWHTLPIWGPGKLEAQKGEAPPHTGMKPAAPQQVGLLRGDLEVELLQPLGKHAVEPFCVVLVAKGADPVVGVAAEQCFTPTVGLDDFVKPEVQGIVEIGSKDGALSHYWSTSPPSALRTGRATRRCTQLASNSMSQNALAT